MPTTKRIFGREYQDILKRKKDKNYFYFTVVNAV